MDAKTLAYVCPICGREDTGERLSALWGCSRCEELQRLARMLRDDGPQHYVVQYGKYACERLGDLSDDTVEWLAKGRKKKRGGYTPTKDSKAAEAEMARRNAIPTAAFYPAPEFDANKLLDY